MGESQGREIPHCPITLDLHLERFLSPYFKSSLEKVFSFSEISCEIASFFLFIDSKKIQANPSAKLFHFGLTHFPLAIFYNLSTLLTMTLSNLLAGHQTTGNTHCNKRVYTV